MNHSDPSLERLLRAAAQCRPVAAGGRTAAEEEAPYGFATRVVVAWLAGDGREKAGLDAKLQAIWFRRAALCALAVMALSVGWSFKMDTTTPNDEMAIASYDATTDLP